MSYSQIDISEVGPAEYPLIAVLRDTIFGEFNHRYAASFDEQIADRQDILALIAHLEGNPVGYKIGYRDRPRHYHSWTGGVLKDYRGQGIAKRMQAWQHGWLRARGYQSVSFNSFNKFRPMLHFGLASGFVPTGLDLRPENDIAIHFTKNLAQPDPPPREKVTPADVQVESVGPSYYGLIAQLATDLIEPQTEADIEREMNNPNALALVAFVDAKPAGFKIGHTRDSRGHLFDSRVGGVLPAYRGRGVATALARHQLGSVAAMGCRVLHVHTRHDNVAMLRTCIRLGFNIVGMLHHERRGMNLVVLEYAFP
jgi:ribosomal protein S18 acetylase RimI-like enzyme